jgi:hypothetical protein
MCLYPIWLANKGLSDVYHRLAQAFVVFLWSIRNRENYTLLMAVRLEDPEPLQAEAEIALLETNWIVRALLICSL